MGFNIFIIVMSLFVMFGCSDKEKSEKEIIQKNDELLVKVAVSRVRKYKETFIFELYKNRQFHVKFGARLRDKPDKLELISIEKEKNILLSKDKMREICQLFEKFEKIKNVETGRWARGGFEIYIQTKEKKVKIYGHKVSEYKALHKLLDRITEFSPLEFDI